MGMKIKKARQIIRSRGYVARRGAYVDGHQDCAGRWHLDRHDDKIFDRRGPGYATLAEAAQAILEQEYLERKN